MPLYEYICQECGHPFEVLIRGDGEKPACDACGSQRLEKQWSVPAAHSAGRTSELPISNMPRGGPCGMGGCGLPECGG